MAHDEADRYLIDQVRSGHASAWQQIIQRYQGRLLAYARSRIASFADAEDTVQEALIGFLQSLPRFDINRSLETFLFTILRYKITDYLRARRSGTRGKESAAEDWWEETTPSHDESPSGHAVVAEMYQTQVEVLTGLLRHLIAELRDRNAFEDLQIIELLFYAGLRNCTAAEILGLDEKHIAGVKYRAILKIQKYLQESDSVRLTNPDEIQTEATVCRVWREQRLTCLKRSTLGQHMLGVLEEPWFTYTQFHLDIVACPMCLANLADLQAEDHPPAVQDSAQRFFNTSVGFLSQRSTRPE